MQPDGLQPSSVVQCRRRRQRQRDNEHNNNSRNCVLHQYLFAFSWFVHFTPGVLWKFGGIRFKACKTSNSVQWPQPHSTGIVSFGHMGQMHSISRHRKCLLDVWSNQLKQSCWNCLPQMWKSAMFTSRCARSLGHASDLVLVVFLARLMMQDLSHEESMWPPENWGKRAKMMTIFPSIYLQPICRKFYHIYLSESCMMWLHMRSHPHALLKTVTSSTSPDCSRCSLHCIKLVSSKPSSAWTQCLYEVPSGLHGMLHGMIQHVTYSRRRA